jgi:hypothetical protein
VVKRHFALKDAALDPIAEIVHDIDLKNGKFGTPKGAGRCGDRGRDLPGSPQRRRSSRVGEQLFDHRHAWFVRSSIKRQTEAPAPTRGGTT